MVYILGSYYVIAMPQALYFLQQSGFKEEVKKDFHSTHLEVMRGNIQ